jgi:hypothetical protein
MTAIEVEIIRTPDVADKFRELDYVQVHSPTLNLYHQKALVVGYDWVEGSDRMKVFLGDFPDKMAISSLIRRLAGPVEFLSNTFRTR